jgi:hypothetical protein
MGLPSFSALIKLDFPTLLRPMNATSGNDRGRKDAGSDEAAQNLRDFRDT